jgi:hypothetical protein
MKDEAADDHDDDDEAVAVGFVWICIKFWDHTKPWTRGLAWFQAPCPILSTYLVPTTESLLTSDGERKISDDDQTINTTIWFAGNPSLWIFFLLSSRLPRWFSPRLITIICRYYILISFSISCLCLPSS